MASQDLPVLRLVDARQIWPAKCFQGLVRLAGNVLLTIPRQSFPARVATPWALKTALSIRIHWIHQRLNKRQAKSQIVSIFGQKEEISLRHRCYPSWRNGSWAGPPPCLPMPHQAYRSRHAVSPDRLAQRHTGKSIPRRARDHASQRFIRHIV